MGPQTTDPDGAAAIERVKSTVTAGGGLVHSAEFWARRTLAHPIKGQREGVYYVARFSVDGGKMPEIERVLRADQTFLRHLLVLADEAKEAPAPEAPLGEHRDPVAAAPAPVAPVSQPAAQ